MENNTEATHRDDFVERRDEVLRKIGRNVLLFQHLEGLLKFLAVTSYLSSPVSRLHADLARRAAFVRRQMLREVAESVLKNLHYGAERDSAAPNQISEPWITFAFQIESDGESIAAERESLLALIKERNQLIHHLRDRWSLHDGDSCRAFSCELDEQRNRIGVETLRYQAYADGLKELLQEQQVFIDSDEGRKLFDLMSLQSSRLAAALITVAAAHARHDGWTSVATAGHHLQQLAPDEFARLKGTYGSLRNLVVAIDLFEILTESTEGGGTRVLYRLRAGNDA